MELLQLESIVLTQLKVRVPKLLNNQFPSISFTNEISDVVPTFPNVYVHELQSSEVGQSLPNQTIHAIRDTIQIEVSSNISKSDARTVINACIEVCKILRYSLAGTPVYTKDNNLHRFIIRVRRVVASGDTFDE